MTESRSCSRRATAPLRGCGWSPNTRMLANRMPAASAVRTAAGAQSTVAAGTAPTSTAVRTSIAVGTAVKAAAVRATVRTATTVEFTPAGVAMAATTRTTAVGATVGTAAVRTFPSILTERWIGVAREYEHNNRGKQDAYG
jgi:hypothetical protein